MHTGPITTEKGLEAPASLPGSTHRADPPSCSYSLQHCAAALATHAYQPALFHPTTHFRQGGKEATRSNALLHKLIVDAVAEVAPGVGRDLIGLVTSRDEIDELLKLHDVIDLVIPRGGNQLVGGWLAGMAARGRVGGGLRWTGLLGCWWRDSGWVG